MGGVHASSLKYIEVLLIYSVGILDTKYRIVLDLYLYLVFNGSCTLQ